MSATKPGYEALRRHRWSAPGAEYFVTFKAQRPEHRLATAAMLAALNVKREEIQARRHWKVRTWVIMPDHIHVMFELGANSSLAQCLRLFKGALVPCLRENGIRWQDGYFEHRMRSDEDRLPVFLYIYLNPYRANLLRPEESWAGYYCAFEDWNWFGPLTDSALPPPEWLRDT